MTVIILNILHWNRTHYKEYQFESTYEVHKFETGIRWTSKQTHACQVSDWLHNNSN